MRLLYACYCILWLSCRPWMFHLMWHEVTCERSVRMFFECAKDTFWTSHLVLWPVWKEQLKSTFKTVAVSSNTSLVASDWSLNILISEFKKQQKSLLCSTSSATVHLSSVLYFFFLLIQMLWILLSKLIWIHTVCLLILSYWQSAQTMLAHKVPELDCSSNARLLCKMLYFLQFRL